MVDVGVAVGPEKKTRIDIITHGPEILCNFWLAMCAIYLAFLEHRSKRVHFTSHRESSCQLRIPGGMGVARHDALTHVCPKYFQNYVVSSSILYVICARGARTSSVFKLRLQYKDANLWCVTY